MGVFWVGMGVWVVMVEGLVKWVWGLGDDGGNMVGGLVWGGLGIKGDRVFGVDGEGDWVERGGVVGWCGWGCGGWGVVVLWVFGGGCGWLVGVGVLVVGVWGLWWCVGWWGGWWGGWLVCVGCLVGWCWGGRLGGGGRENGGEEGGGMR
uniref:Uncharacterized protein n=1 Tax=Knipowitschia caucasica TaxID=637954 RepID=A0AAV2LP69_KNICA